MTEQKALISFANGNQDTADCHDDESPTAVEDRKERTMFNPPLYRQRYKHVADVLEKERVKSVVDFGCSEIKVMPIFKCVPSIESVVGVDISDDALAQNHHLIRPLLTDYLIRRSRPLVVSLYQGDAQMYDVRLAGTEAITLIEVIEHLSPEVLEAVTHNVFSNLHPRLVVMTTPNIEYNVVFGTSAGFRHPDHKFEWTRSEFQKWCDDLGKRYGYTVSYSGVGQPPPHLSEVGHCTQVAVFKIEGEWQSSIPSGLENNRPYLLVKECVHPHQVHKYSRDESTVMEATYYLRMLFNHCLQSENSEMVDYFLDHSTGQLHVRPSFLLHFSQLKKICPDVNTLVTTLLQKGFQFTPDHTHIIYSEPEDDHFDGIDDCDDVQSRDNEQTRWHHTDQCVDHDMKELDDSSEDWTDELVLLA